MTRGSGVLERDAAVAEAIRLDEAGRSMAALKMLDGALRTWPGDYWLEANRARIAVRVLTPPDGLVAVKGYLDRFPARAHPHLLMAEFLNSLGRSEEALAYVEQAEQIGGEAKDSTNAARARALLNLGRTDEAERLADPSVGPLSGMLWLEIHPPLSSLEMRIAADKLEAIGLPWIHAVSSVSEWLQKSGRNDERLAFLTQACEREPTNLSIQTLLARAEASTGNEEAAFQRIGMILNADPGNPGLARLYFQYLRARRRYLDALVFSIRCLKAQLSVKP